MSFLDVLPRNFVEYPGKSELAQLISHRISVGASQRLLALGKSLDFSSSPGRRHRVFSDNCAALYYALGQSSSSH
ncbi:hypothetical protein GB937_003385 [Aspergillus fischeri]|nr:hypothetical protein GB937_003385 [Aspergillus fischeri]